MAAVVKRKENRRFSDDLPHNQQPLIKCLDRMRQLFKAAYRIVKQDIEARG
jgi:hypothetical protein